MLLGSGHGRSNHDVAAGLVLEESTITSHVGQLLAKLGLRSRVQP